MQIETRPHISRSIVGIFDSSEEAQQALEQLRAQGLGPDQVSVMMRDAQAAESIQEQAAGSPVAGGAATGAALGGLLGGVAGWMVSIGAIALPGVGLVIGAGALAAMLMGVALGAATGGLIGALLGLGVPEDEARQYENHVREGRVLLTVHPSPLFDVTRATRILEANGAYDVRVYDASPERIASHANSALSIAQPASEAETTPQANNLVHADATGTLIEDERTMTNTAIEQATAQTFANIETPQPEMRTNQPPGSLEETKEES